LPSGFVEGRESMFDIFLKTRFNTTCVSHVSFQSSDDTLKALSIFSLCTPLLGLQTNEDADYDNHEFEKQSVPVSLF
jgi:hypothetical protein